MAGLREVGVLGEEPVPGVYRIRACAARRVDEPVDAKIRLGGRGRTDADGRIRGTDVRHTGVDVGVHRDRPVAHATRGARDAHRDLAAVGDQQRAERAAPFFAHSRATPKVFGCSRRPSASRQSCKQ